MKPVYWKPTNDLFGTIWEDTPRNKDFLALNLESTLKEMFYNSDMKKTKSKHRRSISADGRSYLF